MDNNGYNRPPEQGNYYQNLYNMFGGYNPIIDGQARSLRRLGLLAGTAAVLNIFFQNIFVIVIRGTTLLSLYQSSSVYMYGISALAYILYLFLPFLVIYCIYSPKEKAKVLIFDKPKNAQTATLAVFAGFAACMASNFAGSVFTSFFSVLGIDFISGMEDNPLPKDFPGMLMMLISTCILPALVEEFAFRGVLLQPLRKHGDRFAVLATSFIFSFMHGNMVQIPFSFICGIVLGYFCIKTKSIWTSVIIHFLNNFSAMLFAIFADRFPDASAFYFYIIDFSIIAAGAVAFIVFRKMNNAKQRKSNDEIEGRLKWALYICTPTVVLGIVDSLYNSFALQKTSTLLGVFVLVGILVAVSVFVIKRINLIRSDARLTQDSTYRISKIIMIISAVVGTILIFNTSLISLGIQS